MDVAAVPPVEREHCWALVAVKRRDQCKSRLSCLARDSRATLAQLMLDAVLGALQASRRVGRVAVISPDARAIPAEVEALRDLGEGLNAALEIGRRHLMTRGAAELVVLPADLPFIRAADVDRLVDEGRNAGVAIAPDDAGRGTNGLYLASTVPFDFHFGEGSFAMHLAESRRACPGAAIVHTDGLAQDIDLADDLRRLASHRDARLRSFAHMSRSDKWLPIPRFV